MKIHVIPGGGHMIVSSHSDRVAELLIAHLNSWDFFSLSFKHMYHTHVYLQSVWNFDLEFGEESILYTQLKSRILKDIGNKFNGVVIINFCYKSERIEHISCLIQKSCLPAARSKISEKTALLPFLSFSFLIPDFQRLLLLFLASISKEVSYATSSPTGAGLSAFGIWADTAEENALAAAALLSCGVREITEEKGCQEVESVTWVLKRSLGRD